MHHLHISGFALFCIALFLCVLVAIILAFVQSIKADRRAAEVEMERLKRNSEYLAPRPLVPTRRLMQRRPSSSLRPMALIRC